LARGGGGEGVTVLEVAVIGVAVGVTTSAILARSTDPNGGMGKVGSRGGIIGQVSLASGDRILAIGQSQTTTNLA